MQRRGFANSAVSLGGRAGGVLAPALTPVLMGLAAAWFVQTDRWRPVFIAYALVGLVWAAWFWLWFRDEPRRHTRVQCGRTRAHRPRRTGRIHRDAPWARFRCAPWRQPATCSWLGLINFFVNVGWIFLATWLPTYLIEVHGTSARSKPGFYTSLTAAAEWSVA